MQKNAESAWRGATQPAPLCQALNQADQAIASMQTEEIYAKAKCPGCLKRETAKLRAANKPNETLSQQAEQLCDVQFKEWHDAISKQSAQLNAQPASASRAQ